MKILLLIAAAAWLRAETSVERGERVVREAIEALGGKRFLQMRDRVERGRVYSFYHEQLRGLAVATIYVRYLTRGEPPDPKELYVRERQSFGKDKEIYAYLFDEQKAWEITFRGARPMPEPTLRRYRETTLRNIFYMLRQRIGESGLAMESRGSDIIDNQPVEVVEVYDRDNNSVTVYFHRSTKLPVRQVFIRRDAATGDRFEEITRFEKYRDVGGVQWPFNVQRVRNGEKIFEQFSESVTIDRDLGDELFTLSADLKILPPAR